MTQRKNQVKPTETEEVRYDTMIGARYTEEKLVRLKQMAAAAKKIYPDFMRALFDRVIAEDDARLGGEG